MGMIGLGSDGDTKTEFLNVFGNEYQEVAVLELNQLKKMQSELTVANAIFQKEDVLEEFKMELKLSYGAEIFDEMTKNEINDWCNKNTGGMIREIIGDDLNVNTKAVLVNAIYLKARWIESFNAELSEKGKFAGGVDVIYMNKVSKMNYLENDIFQAVGLPYEDGLEMVVILPKETRAMDHVFRNLAGNGQAALRNFKSEEVSLSLPQMKLAYEIEMTDVLRELGLHAAFDPKKASFPRISKDIYISSVYHKVLMDVDEDGTRAAAVTAVEVHEKGEPKWTTMDVNRPFLMIIRSTTMKIPVFMAWVKKPVSS